MINQDWSSTTAAKPIGECTNCGGQRYEGLVHHCSTGAIISHHLNMNSGSNTRERAASRAAGASSEIDTDALRRPGAPDTARGPAFVPYDGEVRLSPEIKTVKWIDSSLQNGQVDRHDFPKPETIVSIGWLVDETDEYVTVARDDMGNGDYRGLCCIPKVSVLT